MAISKNLIKYIRQLEQKKFRRREGLFVAEGTKVVGDLLAHYQPHSIFATPEWLRSNSSLFTIHSSLFNEVTPDELSRISFQQHPQQVLALFPIPSLSTLRSALPLGSAKNSQLSTLNSQLYISVASPAAPKRAAMM